MTFSISYCHRFLYRRILFCALGFVVGRIRLFNTIEVCIIEKPMIFVFSVDICVCNAKKTYQRIDGCVVLL